MPMMAELGALQSNHNRYHYYHERFSSIGSERPIAVKVKSIQYRTKIRNQL